MTKIKIAFLTIALLVTTAASAQFSFGIQGGGNLSTFTSNEDGLSTHLKPGFSAGVSTEFSFARTTGLRSGLFFTTKGARTSVPAIDDFNTTANLMYLQVPVHLAQRINIRGQRFVLHGGPYVAYGIAGGSNRSVDGANVPSWRSFGSGDDRYKRWDFGVGIGFALEQNRILTGIGWDMGLLDISNFSHARRNERVRTQNFFLTVEYRL